MSFKNLIDQLVTTSKANAPALLTAAGITGVLTTAIVSHRVGYKVANEISWTEIREKRPLTAKEKVELYWKSYIPPVVLAGVTVGCVFSATSVSLRRNALLMSALSLSEKTYREYRDEVVQTLGKAKDQKVSDAIATEKVKRAEGSEVVFVGDDKVLVFDTLSSRFFQSTRAEIERAEIEINRQILGDMYASQNEWYDKLGLDPVGTGDDIGWNNNRPLEVVFSAVLREDKPVLALSYRFQPYPGFHKIW